jgi:hypothetical protein
MHGVILGLIFGILGLGLFQFYFIAKYYSLTLSLESVVLQKPLRGQKARIFLLFFSAIELACAAVAISFLW